MGSECPTVLQQQLDRQVPEGSTDKPSVELEVDLQQQDEYQRVLAYVWQDNQLLNQVMIAQGHALAASRLPNVRYEERLKRAQESARLSGLGLWDPQNPMRQTPVEFRGTL
ncbi:MAG: thermonuclease family protein [Synechococcales cyanobacterium RU_4_20]|nr:thermonuclease family protein [Synechococcales cyanobacterium RU_4_20]